MKRFLCASIIALCATSAGAVLNCQNFTQDGMPSANWYVGQSASVFDALDTDGDLYCYANGAELTYIRNNFSGLRLRTTRGVQVMAWEFDDAAFIVDNLEVFQ